MSLLQRVMSNLIVALRPSVNMHIKEILQMLRRHKYSSLQVTSSTNDSSRDTDGNNSFSLAGHDAG
jgi:hypothetical protein